MAAIVEEPASELKPLPSTQDPGDRPADVPVQQGRDREVGGQ